jgi:hypothetical protein
VRETLVTSAFCAIALGLALTAAHLEPEARVPEALSDEGQPFYPDFKDPLACKALEIIDYNETTATAEPFKVELRNGRFVIPTHHGYPADAKDRLAKTAAALMDLRKDTVRSNSIADHASFGVIDPMDADATSLAGRGKRVTLKDADGNVLADYILGKPVQGKTGYRYVRIPGGKTTYAVRTDAEPSADFADWVKADVLRLSADDIRRITIHDYSVDEQFGAVTRLEKTTLSRRDGDWVTDDGGAPAKATVQALVASLANLRIVDVRPKPDDIARNLVASNRIELSMENMVSLRGMGFFFTPRGQLLSNEGETIVETRHGLIYTLRFGEVAGGSGIATVGDENAMDIDKAQESRYVFITVRYETTRAAEHNEGDASKIENEGKRRAGTLSRRFAPWYYVISGTDFAKLRPGRRKLVVDGAAHEPADAIKPRVGSSSPPPVNGAEQESAPPKPVIRSLDDTNVSQRGGPEQPPPPPSPSSSPSPLP